MPTIEFDAVAKRFGETQVLKEFSVTVDDGEFLVLLGPSGCGKSTLLRMLAGLLETTSGRIRFDGTDVTSWDVRKRDIAFVFQSYALYPQMTVRQNIAFPLLMDRMSGLQHLPIVSYFVKRRLLRATEISARVSAIAEQLGLTPLMDRRPATLSGGQRQRVALARSLVREPSIYLLDEPLSNLDAKLRSQMRSDITALHRKVAKTFVYVTHDQVEAMTMATRIVVLDKGRIQQIGTPDEIYDRPRNMFTATFVGSPAMNMVSSADYAAHSAGPRLPESPASAEIVVGVRPENLEVVERGEGIPAIVETVERIGAETLVGCRIATGVGDLHYARVQGTVRYKIGSTCGLRVRDDGALFFSLATGDLIETAEFRGDGFVRKNELERGRGAS